MAYFFSYQKKEDNGGTRYTYIYMIIYVWLKGNWPLKSRTVAPVRLVFHPPQWSSKGCTERSLTNQHI